MPSKIGAMPVFFARMKCVESDNPQCVGKVYDFVNVISSNSKQQQMRAQDFKRFAIAVPVVTSDELYYYDNETAQEYIEDFMKHSDSIFVPPTKCAGVVVQCLAVTKITKEAQKEIVVQYYQASPSDNSKELIAKRAAEIGDAPIAAPDADDGEEEETAPTAQAPAKRPPPGAVAKAPAKAPAKRPPPGR